MRSKILNLSLAASFLLFAGASQAGTLTSATWAGSFQGTPFLATFGVPGGPGGLMASGTSVGTTANVQITVAPRLSSSLNTTGQAPVFISQTLGGSQAIAITAGGAAANRGIAGLVNVLIGQSSTNGTQLFSVPLTVGFPVVNPFFQNTTAVVPGLSIPVSVTATALPWTTGAVSFTGLTNNGTAIPNFARTGGNNLTANGGGTITLVAPAITTVCAGAIFGVRTPCTIGAPLETGFQQKSHTVSATLLTLHFAPEPGTLLLRGAALAALVGLAAISRRKQAELG